MPEEIPYYFIAVTMAHYNYNEGLNAHRSMGAHIGLEISSNLEPSLYYVSDKVFNHNGSNAYTEAAVLGLIANMQAAHQKGWRDMTEHLQFIIDKLSEGATTPIKGVQTEVKTINANIRPSNSNNT